MTVKGCLRHAHTCSWSQIAPEGHGVPLGPWHPPWPRSKSVTQAGRAAPPGSSLPWAGGCCLIRMWPCQGTDAKLLRPRGGRVLAPPSSEEALVLLAFVPEWAGFPDTSLDRSLADQVFLPPACPTAPPQPTHASWPQVAFRRHLVGAGAFCLALLHPCPCPGPWKGRLCAVPAGQWSNLLCSSSVRPPLAWDSDVF